MAKRRKRRSTKRKASVSRKRRRRNPAPKAHRITVYRTRKRGKKQGLRRSPFYRLKPRRVNPNKMFGRYFGKNRMINAVSLLAGLGGAALTKSFAIRTIINPFFDRFFGVLSIIAGATINMQSRKLAFKSAGTGFVVFGLYDLLVQNVPALGAYLPSISGPSFMSRLPAETTEGGLYYGRTVGAGINYSRPEVVGANIYTGMSPEIISGDDMDLADALEMSLD